MEIQTYETRKALGQAAGQQGARQIKEAIEKQGEANIILATGNSQFETIAALVADKTIDWSKVRMFHLDEYIGMSVTHKASFRKYLTERFLDQVSPLAEAILINGEDHPEQECKRLEKAISAHPIDVAFVGIGENGHLAFNDPPADFDNDRSYLVVDLNAQCRQQQLGEGWFSTLEQVPRQAISMSIKQIMKSKHIICSVPDQRKAQAVKDCLLGGITNLNPASILQQHPDCTCYLDRESASLL
ncbi:glucosamine-6-phosphate deaminase [Sphingobacterium griseoflavum]|uniref:Glucosamine-6-phosphate deaminase n=1 Tax=Sphingobacterium griseoflavum TaxID=1474952 RepID=A0ABQ3HYP0_9SPHI|nr:glucosamine-6-phosphate deaminase [Sphingobacterium griseoflavum]GHE33305.1 glucosamine-6-phosphate deaminase [Sphingobacterium griseoflavum]